MEQSEKEESNIELPKSYLLIVNSIGIALIIVFIYFGYNHWPFISTILLGAVAQTIFRITKRLIKNKLKITYIGNGIEYMPNMSAIKIYALIYITMLFVTALWYGVGVALGKIF